MNRVSRANPWLSVLILLLLSILTSAQNRAAEQAGPQVPDPKSIFEAGQAALQAGNLEQAERKFRQVLAIDRAVWGAYANLGVIHMRRKQWPQALAMLHQAEKLAPAAPGIQLNIGLVYFRQNDFAGAIQPFESVIKHVPDSFQARYLLGLCYFFNDRWTESVGALEPLWGQASNQLNYLYVLGRAAEKAKDDALSEKAYARLAEVGQGTPAFHLIMGKAHLNRGEYDQALTELRQAEQADPKLPFVHFNLGLVHLRKQQFEEARAEFQKDLSLEPDAAFTYEQLGDVNSTLQREDEAAANYRQAIKLDPRLVGARMGLTKIEQHRRHYAAALIQLDAILQLDRNNAGAHYQRGQVLVHLGRQKEGRDELRLAAKLLNQQRGERQKQLEGEGIPSPELATEPQ